MSTRSRVLSLYRTILRTGRQWQGPQEVWVLCQLTQCCCQCLDVT